VVTQCACFPHSLPMQAIKQVKGILNKLTPEKFERLLDQLVAAVTGAAVLHGTIRLVFENAVVQPTFVSMYAELCERLAQVGPSGCPAVASAVYLFCCPCRSACVWGPWPSCRLLGGGMCVQLTLVLAHPPVCLSAVDFSVYLSACLPVQFLSARSKTEKPP
jgi:MIF4G domain